MPKNRHPQGCLENLPTSDIQFMVGSLKELYDLGKPETDEQVEERVDQYFALCQASGLRPGVESLATALHISRTTLYRWSNGEDCSPKRQEIVQAAKSLIYSFVEQAMMTGKINPASGIFLMKNWMNYKDTLSIEESLPSEVVRKALPASQLPRLGEVNDDFT